MSLRSRRSNRRETALAVSVVAGILLLLAVLLFPEQTAIAYRVLSSWLAWLDARV